MKFSVPSSDLLKKLQLVVGAIATNPVLPILEDFLFELNGNQLSLSATDLETSINTQMEVNGEKDGKVAIPAKILLEIIKQLPQQPLTFKINDDNFNIAMTSSFGQYNIAGENGDDFPKIPEPDSVDTITLPSNSLQKGIKKTIFATSNDDLRPAMTGVYFEVNFNTINFVATDAHRLVKYSFNKDIKSDVINNFIVPKKALNLLKNALTSEGEVLLQFNKSNAFFNFDNSLIICRLIDAKYPNYESIIPKNNPNELTINRRDFMNSVKRIAIFANKTTNQIILDLNKKGIVISAQDLDFSNDAKESIPCNYEGQEMKIGYNSKFIIEVLNILESEEIRIEMPDPARTSIIVPEDMNDGEQIMILIQLAVL